MNEMPEDIDDAGYKWKVFDCLSLPALILKPDKTIVDANPGFLERFNVRREQVIGKACHDFFYNSLEPCVIETCALAQVLKDRRGHSSLRYVNTGSGEEKWDNRVFSPILDDAGEVAYIVECLHEVTQIKALERELSGLREFTQKLIQSSFTAIIAADMKGAIIMMNPAAEELTGYSLKEAQSRITVRDIHPPGQAREVMRKLRDERIGGKGKLPCTRLDIVDAKGQKIPVELTAAIIYDGGREVGTMGVFNDLREKLENEQRTHEMLMRTSRAEKMASLGQLAAGVAHEINNPLTGIIFYADLIMNTLGEDDPRRKKLECIFEDAKRCGKIVKGLLAYSRQSNPSSEIFHINALLDHSMSLVRDSKIFSEIRIVKELSGEMMPVQADRDQLGQVIFNLVMNAVDAMDRKGTLTLRTYRGKPAGKVYLEVSDTGCGIPQQNLPRIFDPFFTTKGPGEGTGLGLSTAYGILAENGGRIWVKETSKRGTTFVVEVPLYQNG